MYILRAAIFATLLISAGAGCGTPASGGEQTGDSSTTSHVVGDAEASLDGLSEEGTSMDLSVPDADRVEDAVDAVSEEGRSADARDTGPEDTSESEVSSADTPSEWGDSDRGQTDVPADGPDDPDQEAGPDALDGLVSGSECTETSWGHSTECASGLCVQGPPEVACGRPRLYCLAPEMNCPKPGEEGVPYGTIYSDGGRKYECRAGVGLGIANGEICQDETDELPCASGRCLVGPWDQSFCAAVDQDCPQPREQGTSVGSKYLHDGGMWACDEGGTRLLGIANGYLCEADEECESGACEPGPSPDGARYCMPANADCVVPHRARVSPNTHGTDVGEGYGYGGYWWDCVADTGLVRGEPLDHGPYGAQACDDAALIGGGPGYPHLVTPTDAVTTAEQLRDALRAVRDTGGVVYVADDAVIQVVDVAADLPLEVGAGVTLASGRGRPTDDGVAQGALLFIDPAHPSIDDYYASPLVLRVTGSDARITGIRLRGTERHIRDSRRCVRVDNGIQVRAPGVHIDNCEFSQWSHYAVSLEGGGLDALIEHNHFHHNRRNGLGYGVTINGLDNPDSPTPQIRYNHFDWGRHAIAAAGSRGTNYHAYCNIVGENWVQYAFDLHDRGSLPGGRVILVENNSFYEYSRLGSVHLEGPLDPAGSLVTRNHFEQYVRTPGVGYAVSQNYLPTSYSDFVNLTVIDNRFGVDPIECAAEVNCTYDHECGLPGLCTREACACE